MAILNKSDIINGKKNISKIHFDELGGELKLRPLTDGEINRIVRLLNSGGLDKLKTKPTLKNGEIDKDAIMKNLNLEIDVQKSEKVKYEADCMAVAFSLNNEENKDTWSVEEVENFPAGSVKVIALKVYEISGIADPVKTRRDVETFRKVE